MVPLIYDSTNGVGDDAPPHPCCSWWQNCSHFIFFPMRSVLFYSLNVGSPQELVWPVSMRWKLCYYSRFEFSPERLGNACLHPWHPHHSAMCATDCGWETTGSRAGLLRWGHLKPAGLQPAHQLTASTCSSPAKSPDHLGMVWTVIVQQTCPLGRYQRR